MRKAIYVYLQFAKIQIRTAMAYRMDFLINLIVAFGSNMLIPLVTLLIYSTGATFPGWTIYEALLIQSVFMLSHGLVQVLFGNVIGITMNLIREGTYDTLMLKPSPVILSTIAQSFSLFSLSEFLGGLLMFVYSAVKVGTITPAGSLIFAVLFVCGMCFSLGQTLLMASSMFKWIGNSRIYEISSAFTAFARYPSSIYSKFSLGLLTYVFPVGILGFLPAEALLGRASAGQLLAVVPCLLFMLIGIYVYNKMIYLYQSAGG